ncbi:MAG: hypothetical protein ACAI38_00495 [Myxococcota bacterium]
MSALTVERTATPLPGLASAVAVVPSPVADRRLVKAQPRMTALTEIAKHDPDLALKLQERLDFSAILRGGTRVAVEDAYAVLSKPEFTRFEIVTQGMRDAVRPLHATLAAWPLTALAGVAATHASYLSMLGRYQEPGVFVGLVSALVVLIGIPLVIAGALTEKDTRLAQIGPRLASLKPPTQGAATAEQPGTS